MATINFFWNGKDKQTLGTTISQYRSPVSGFFDTTSYKESWTGSALGYASNASHPTSGTLQSWSFQDKDSDFSFVVTDLNLKLAPNSTYRTLVTGLFAGRDQWHGNGEDNFFYWSVGGDTYHGGAGVDTLDAFTATKAQVLGERPTFLRKGAAIEVTATGNLDVTLDSVERLRFSDISVAVDLDGHAGTAARIAGAVFGRDALKAKDLIGVAIGLLDSGVTPLALTEAALPRSSAATTRMPNWSTCSTGTSRTHHPPRWMRSCTGPCWNTACSPAPSSPWPPQTRRSTPPTSIWSD